MWNKCFDAYFFFRSCFFKKFLIFRIGNTNFCNNCEIAEITAITYAPDPIQNHKNFEKFWIFNSITNILFFHRSVIKVCIVTLVLSNTVNLFGRKDLEKVKFAKSHSKKK